MIPRFYQIPFLGTLWVERQKIPLASPFLMWNNCNGELLLWVGKFHLIYTPRNWRRHRHDGTRCGQHDVHAQEVPERL